MGYSFNSKGNLDYRQDNLTGYKESFGYDPMNRLKNWYIYKSNVLQKSDSLTFNATTGNIATKTDIGNYAMNYGEVINKPHALTSISGVPAGFPSDGLTVTYTDFKKIKTLAEGAKTYALTYGVDEQRIKSVYAVNGVTQSTRYYLGNYEEEINSAGSTRKIYYLGNGAVCVNNNGKDSILFMYKDHLGSLVALTDYSGNVLERYAYDPWGNRRNPANWTQKDTRSSWLLNRGFTMHEHLDAFGIINMNGRVYDPLTAQFFSPDPYVQAPDNWLNYNRYAYALNNPLIYTDPDGEWFGYDDLIVAAAGFVFNYVGYGISTGDWGWKAVASGGMGAVSAWLGYNTAGLSTATWAPGQGITSATWNTVGSMAINTVANQIFPPMTIPISNNFGISVSPAFGWGTDGLSVGFNMSGIYSDEHITIGAGIGAGDNYWGWNVSAIDTETGRGGGYGNTYYGGADVMGHSFKPQRVGNYAYYWKDGSFTFQDDAGWKIFGGDTKDRQRTVAWELAIGKFSVGSYIYTNNGNEASNNIDPKNPTYLANDGHKTWKDGRVYFAPLWVGYRNGNQVTRIGLSREWVQKVFQNGTHKLLFNTPYFLNYDEFNLNSGVYNGNYYYSGYRNPLTLWGR